MTNDFQFILVPFGTITVPGVTITVNSTLQKQYFGKSYKRNKMTWIHETYSSTAFSSGFLESGITP